MMLCAIVDGVDREHACALPFCLAQTLNPKCCGAAAESHVLPGPQDCGEKGTTISGGQRQRCACRTWCFTVCNAVSCFLDWINDLRACRLAIARALVRRPSVLLLDEVRLCTPASITLLCVWWCVRCQAFRQYGVGS